MSEDDRIDAAREAARERQAARERAEGPAFGQSGPTEDQEAEEWQARGERIADLAGQLCGYFYNHEYRDFEKALVEMKSALDAWGAVPASYILVFCETCGEMLGVEDRLRIRIEHLGQMNHKGLRRVAVVGSTSSHGSRAFGHGSVAPGITSDLDPTTEGASSAVSGARQEALSEALRCIADVDSAVVAAEWMAWARAVARDALRADRDRERFAGETVEILMDDHTWREARILTRGAGAGDHGEGWLLVEEGGLQSWVEPGEWRNGQARGQ